MDERIWNRNEDGGTWMLNGEDESGGQVIEWVRHGPAEIRLPEDDEVGLVVAADDPEMSYDAAEVEEIIREDPDHWGGYLFYPTIETRPPKGLCPVCKHEWEDHYINYYAKEAISCMRCEDRGHECGEVPPQPFLDGEGLVSSDSPNKGDSGLEPKQRESERRTTLDKGGQK